MRTERSPIFRNEAVDPIRLDRKVQLLLDTIDLTHDLPPDQLSRGVACITKAQWIASDAKLKRMRHEMTIGLRQADASDRAYERWKRKIRDIGLEAKPQTHLDLDSPVFCVDMAQLERDLDEAQVRIRTVRTRRSPREFTAEELGDELGISDKEVARWAREGLPHSIGLGKGSPRLFSLDEAKTWLLEHGSPRVKAKIRLAAMTVGMLGEAIASTDSLFEAQKRLGLTEPSFRKLRRKLKVHAPLPADERVPAWKIIKADEFLAAIEKHEGRRPGIAEELGLSLYEVRSGISHHDLTEHPLVLRPRPKRPFTRDQLISSIERHKGMRKEIARELGVSKITLSEAILDYELEGHPMLQFGKIPYRRQISVGRGAPGKPGFRARGHALPEPVARTTRLVPFWLAALREILAKHSGRGASRRASEATGISPPQIANLLRGNRLPGYEYMQAIMFAAGRPEPEWRQALHELIEAHKPEVDKARGHKTPLSAASAVATIVGSSTSTILGLVRGTTPSMEMIRRLLEASGRAYMVETIEPQEMIGAGSGRPKVPLSERLTPDDLRLAMARASSWSSAAESLGISKKSLESLVETFGLTHEFPPQKGRLTCEVLERAFSEHGPVVTTEDLEAVARRLKYHPHVVRRAAAECGFHERGLLSRRLRSSP